MERVDPLDPPPSPAEVVAGLVLAALVPLVGFVVGGVWLARRSGSRAPGAVALALAAAGLAFWLRFTFAS
ncbi:MAG TPA: hypothetical protein VGJ32_08850 [Solirubrobacteraceae bacterium]|jgi:positive regulator of sigma E activity